MDQNGTPPSESSKPEELTRDELKFLEKMRNWMLASKSGNGSGYAVMFWVQSGENGDNVVCQRRCDKMQHKHFPAMHKQCGETLDYWQRASRKPIRDDDEDETEREESSAEPTPKDGD